MTRRARPDLPMPLDGSLAEQATVARFNLAPAAPESYRPPVRVLPVDPPGDDEVDGPECGA